MKYLDEYRDAALVKGMSERISRAASGLDLTFMEVCGTHTMSIARYGLKSLFPSGIKLISGPGCPVCVTPNNYLDHAIAIARLPNVVITTFGDMMNVPGSTSSLSREKANGCDVRMIYSPLDALEIAKANSPKEVVFLSVGFETTVPAIASTLMMAKNSGIQNFSLLTANKTVPAALEALLTGELKLNGFLLPGHVSTIIGGKAYIEMIEKYRVPCSIAGFEPLDIMESLLHLIEQNKAGLPKLDIAYRRSVTMDGNIKAKSIIAEVFERADANWRGIGVIPGSGLKLKKSFSAFDAALKFDVQVEETIEEKGCICGSILQGLATPKDCPLFGKVCRPDSPVGACMVSSEGTCAACYRYDS